MIDRIAQAAVHDAGGVEQTPVEPIVILSMGQRVTAPCRGYFSGG